MSDVTIHKLNLGEKKLEVRLSPRAQTVITRETAPLYIEMELYFSCLIRKRVNFLAAERSGAGLRAPLDARVTIGFRPVMTRHCSIGDVVGEPDIENFPLKRVNDFTPSWLAVDYKSGKWIGDFGFSGAAGNN